MKSRNLSEPKLSSSKLGQSRVKIFRDSSGSLRREQSATWSFPKAQRFASRTQILDVPYFELPSTLEKRFTSMGKGDRYAAVTNDNPSPNNYNLPSQFDPLLRKAGAIFGPVPVKHESKKYPYPGPGAYNLEKSFIDKSKGVTIKSRKVIHDKNSEFPAPNNYSISEKLIKRSRFNDINVTMGRGKRYEFFDKSKIYAASQDYPGPGSYTIMSKFDNFTTPMLRSKLSLSNANKLSESFFA